MFSGLYDFLVEALTRNLPTTILVISLVLLTAALILSLLKGWLVRKGLPQHTDYSRRQQGLDLVNQGNTQIQAAETARQQACQMRTTGQAEVAAGQAANDQARAAAGQQMITQAATLDQTAAQQLQAGQADVERGNQILEQNQEHPRQWGLAVTLLGLIILAFLALVLYSNWINSDSTVSSSDAARATKNLVAKAQTVFAPGYEIMVDGSRFELHMPFKGLPSAQQTIWKKVIDDSVKEWNKANPFESREVVDYESASLVGYQKDGKFQGVLLTFQAKQWKCDHWVEKNLNFIHPLRNMTPNSVVRTADSLAQKLDTLAAGGGTPGGLPGMGPLQEAAPQF